MLCKYKDIFDPPNTGVHSYRLFNIAIVDVIATLVLSYFISILINTDYIHTTIILFILGIIIHRLFCVRTTIDKLLFD
jgi:hypothetical protein